MKSPFRPLFSLACLLLLGLTALPLRAQYDLIPQPRSLEVLSEAPARARHLVVERLEGPCPDSLREWYSLEVRGNKARIQAYTPAGEQWARRTLDQLRRPNGTCPQVRIQDWPAFPLRGFMYDSGRNFVEVAQIKTFIDLMAQYKLNVFHWHLTDKPAWRIECKAYPQLNDPAFQRVGRQEGRFYTYDQIREVIAYAAERGIRILPELDMPGHSDFFDATFGCKMNSPRGMEILEACLQEFFAEIPVEDVPWIHIGSDEVNISNPQEFMEWAVGLVRKAGREPMVWDPGLPADDQVMHQVWREATAAVDSTTSKRVVDSYMGYLNYVDPIMLSARIFLHTPCLTGVAAPNRLGGILCLWNDVRVTDPSRLGPHNGMMGGLLPFAERFWNGGVVCPAFQDVLEAPHTAPMQALTAFQAKMQVHKERFLPQELASWFPNRPTTRWEVELFNAQDSLLHEVTAYGDMVDLDALCTARGLKDVAWCRATQKVLAAEARTVPVRIGFDAPARSNRNGDGIARQGEWENYGTVELNGKPVAPPVWETPGLYRFHFNTWAAPEEELPYTDEQLYWTRRPVPLPLQAGENTLVLTLRKHFAGQRFQFAVLDLE